MIELECLAAAWAIKKCRQFIQGLHTFNLITDHRPLVPILNEYSLDKLDNLRLLRRKLQMTKFMFVAKWVPGKQHQEADVSVLSRSPVGNAKASDELREGPNTFTTRSAVVGLISGSSEEQTQDSILKSIQSAAAVDPIMLELRDVIMKGFPNDKCNLFPTLRPFWDARKQLAIDEEDDMLVMGARVVIPRSQVQRVINTLLSMHQGASKMRQRARISVY